MEPVLSMTKSVVVAPATVEEEMRKRLVLVSVELAEMASLANGEVVPRPRLPVEVSLMYSVSVPVVFLLKKASTDAGEVDE